MLFEINEEHNIAFACCAFASYSCAHCVHSGCFNYREVKNMNAVKNWSAVISGSVLLCVILEFLIPPGKVGKSMNIILGAFVMCSAIGWFKSFDVRNFKSSFNLKKFEAPEEKTKKLNSTAEEIIARNIESIIQRILKDINVPYKKIEIFMDRNEDNCIVMIRCKIYISNSAKDDSEKIKKEIESKLNINTEVISI